jgi:hypothetical protein
MSRRPSWLHALAVGLAILPAGCGSSHSSGAVAEVHAAISSVPKGVACIEIQVTTTGGLVDRTFGVTAGSSPVLELANLSPGPATFAARAFDKACAKNAPPQGDPSWLSRPVAATIELGHDVLVELLLERPAGAEVGVGFDGPRIELLAGTPSSSGGHVDGVGTAAQLSSPNFPITDDGFSHVWFGEFGNADIRQLDLATGAVTTLAGNPSVRAIKDGIGSGASFKAPEKMALVGGLLYVPDVTAIRVVAPTTGQVITLAGSNTEGLADGVGSVAQFQFAVAAAYVPPSTLFVTDANRIRKVDIPTGKVTTFAGDPMNAIGASDGVGAAAQFNKPQAIIFDGTDSLYVADGFNGTIRKININTAQVITWAGVAGDLGSVDGPLATARFSFPLDLLIDGKQRMWVADEGTCNVRRIDLKTGAVSTVAGMAGVCVLNVGPLPGSFYDPFGLALLHDGSLVIADGSANVLTVARGL